MTELPGRREGLPTLRRLFTLVVIALAACGVEDATTTPQPVVTDRPPPTPVPRTSCIETPCEHPPDPSADAPQAAGPTVHFAWTKWRLGSGGADGEPDELGYDLDGYKFEAGGYPHCKPVQKQNPKLVVEDGPLGQDNSFVRSLATYTLWLDAKDANAELAGGAGPSGLLLTLDALGPETNQVGLKGRLRRALGDGTPGADITDFSWWAAAPDTELTGYVRDGTLVLRGGRAFIHLPITLSYVSATLKGRYWIPIRSVLVTATVQGGKLTNGRIAGIAKADDLAAAWVHLGQLAGYCKSQPSLIDYLPFLIRLASDLPLDGQHDPDRPCDAVSIGLGFEAAPSKLAGDMDLPVLVPLQCDGTAVEGFGAP